MNIRNERPGDEAAIAALTEGAFASAPHSSGTESRIIDALRERGALALSLVAERDGEIVGHVAFSPVRIDRADGPWFGLGPVSVRPALQGQGIGQALINAGIARLRDLEAGLCVVLGGPNYYGRFGFRHRPGLTYDVPVVEAFQCLVLSGEPPSGEVTYHPAFDVQ